MEGVTILAASLLICICFLVNPIYRLGKKHYSYTLLLVLLNAASCDLDDEILITSLVHLTPGLYECLHNLLLKELH